jgi:leader peptidase (prepilin peptidase)/N-methyltransferase
MIDARCCFRGLRPPGCKTCPRTQAFHNKRFRARAPIETAGRNPHTARAPSRLGWTETDEPALAPLSADAFWPIIAAPFVGSFLSVVIARLPEGETVLFGRSRCPTCRQALGPVDLLPLVSWLVQRGRCRHCGGAVSWLYPVIELAALAIALWAASAVSGWLLWATCGLGWTLLALAVIDVRALLLPDALTLPLIPAGLAVATALDRAALAEHVAGAAAGYGAFVLIELGYARARGRAGLGRGDAKLLGAAGAWVSWSGLPAVVLIAALAALAAVAAARLAGRPAAASGPIPFGPWLALGIWLVWLYGVPVL